MSETKSQSSEKYSAEKTATELYGKKVVDNLQLLANKIDINFETLLQTLIFYPEIATRDIPATNTNYLSFKIEEDFVYFRINLADYLIKLDEESGYGFYDYKNEDRKEFVSAGTEEVSDKLSKISEDWTQLKQLLLDWHEKLVKTADHLLEISNSLDSDQRFSRVGDKTDYSSNHDGSDGITVKTAQRIIDENELEMDSKKKPLTYAIRTLTRSGLIDPNTRIITKMGDTQISYSRNEEGLNIKKIGRDSLSGDKGVSVFLETIPAHLDLELD